MKAYKILFKKVPLGTFLRETPEGSRTAYDLRIHFHRWLSRIAVGDPRKHSRLFNQQCVEKMHTRIWELRKEWELRKKENVPQNAFGRLEDGTQLVIRHLDSEFNNETESEKVSDEEITETLKQLKQEMETLCEERQTSNIWIAQTA